MSVFLPGQQKTAERYGVLFETGVAFDLMPEMDGEVSNGDIIELNIGMTQP